ncbi:hypothetical protein WN943_006183 [Citrus x changshan-huyou]
MNSSAEKINEDPFDKVEIISSLGGGVLIGVLALIIWVTGIGRKRYDEDDNEGNNQGLNEYVNYEFELSGPRKYSYKELSQATNNFSDEQKLGQGGFGGVYKGISGETNAYVAVKRVSKGSKQGIKEYASEVKVISRLRHRNLVQLLGWCHEKNELLLVYEFMPNGSLDSHHFEENRFLTWELRYKIAQDLAAGLLYLQEEWDQCVLHRDIKSSNIMGSMGEAIRVLNFEAPLPILPPKMPVLTYLYPPVGMLIIDGIDSKGRTM